MCVDEILVCPDELDDEDVTGGKVADGEEEGEEDE